MEVPQTSFPPAPLLSEAVGKWVPAAPENRCQPSLIPGSPWMGRGVSHLYLLGRVLLEGPNPLTLRQSSVNKVYSRHGAEKCDNFSTFFKHCVLGDFWDFYLGQTFLAYLRKDYPLTILLWPPNFQIQNCIFRTVLHFWDKNTALLFQGRRMKMLQKHWKVSQTSVMTSFPQGLELLQEAKRRRSNWNMSLQPEQDWRYLPR